MTPRKLLVVGLALFAAGSVVGALAARSGRQIKPSPFAYAVTFFAPPAGWGQEPEAPEEPAEEAPPEPETPPEAAPDVTPEPEEGAETDATGDAEAELPLEPLDLKELYGILTPDDVEAIARVAAPAGLPLGLMQVVTHVPASSWAVPERIAVALVGDGQADAFLDPLVAPEARGVDVYLGSPGSLEAILAPYETFPPDAAASTAAHLPPSARSLRGLMLVRASAAEAFGLDPGGPRPNALVVPLDPQGRTRPGDESRFRRPNLEEVVAAALPLYAERGISFRAQDLRLTAARPERWAGTAALALMLAGGAAIVAAGLAHLAAMEEARGLILESLVRGARVTREAGATTLGVLAVLWAVTVAGAAWGGPVMLDLLVRASPNTVYPTLDQIGLPGSEPTLSPLVSAFVASLMGVLVLRAIVAVGIPSLVPGLGLVTAAAVALLWGAMLAPVALTSLDRLPWTGAVAAIELAVVATVALGAWHVLEGVLRPAAFGQETRRQGYAAAVERLYMLLPLVAALALAAALLRTLLLAGLGWLG